jgi:DNA-binding NtrC family response regulator
MVVLSPGREITAADIPRALREGGSARFLPVPVGAVLRGQVGTGGRELEFIVRSLVELKLQVEELRQRADESREVRDGRLDGGEVMPAARIPGVSSALTSVGIEPREEQPPANIVTIAPGMKMSDIERAAIVAALKETRGNRRKAAEQLGIGERTLYRKLKEYGIPET